MLLRDALSAAISRLSAAHIGSPRLNAEVLLMFALGKDRAYLYAHAGDDLDQAVFARYDDLLAQRAQGIPSQYLTGHQEFWGLDFIVTPAVLIPRPETEHLIETVLPLARPMSAPSIADVGTGSGCIALVLAKELPRAKITGVDISQDALEIARANAARHQLEGRIRFQLGDLLAGFSPGRSILWSPTRLMWGKAKKTRSNWKCANLSRDMRCLPEEAEPRSSNG